VALVRDRALTVLVNAFLALQAVHLFGLYGLGENSVSIELGLDQWLERYVGGVRTGVKFYALDRPSLQTLVACITTALFFAATYRLVSCLRKRGLPQLEDPSSRIAGSATLVETTASS
jgi:hypothetical protein